LPTSCVHTNVRESSEFQIKSSLFENVTTQVQVEAG